MADDVADALRPFLTPVGDLRPHPSNPRNGDVDAIADSLRRHRQYAPVVYQRSTGRIVKGHHVFEAALSLGWTELAAVPLDVDDDRALRILLDDNRSSDRGRYDEAQLADLLEQLAATEAGLDDSLYELDDLDELLGTLERVAAAPLGGPDRPAAPPAPSEPDEPLVDPEKPVQEELAEASPPDPATSGTAKGLREVVLVFSADEHATLGRGIAALRRSGWRDLNPTSTVSEVLQTTLTAALEAAAEPDPLPPLPARQT